MNKLKAIWKIEELRGKILVTLLLLLAFRLGCCLPVPFVSNTALDAMFSNNSIFGYMNMLSGGALSRSAFFALGVSPYINASIITQLLCVALPSWEALQKETTGKDKLDEYTKRIALAMAVVMSVGYYFVLRNYGALKYTAGKSGIFAAIVIIATFLAGSQISVWLGGRIDEYGIGNGVSLLIFAGIVSRWSDINSIVTNVIGKVKAGEWLYSLIGILTAVAMLAAVWFVTYSDGAERRVPVQYAARTQRVRPAASYIPIKLLMSGVMPIIFAGVIPALGNPDRNEDAGIHQLFYQLLNRSKSETVSFHDHMKPIIDRYSEAEMQGVKTSLQAPELIAPEWIDFTHYNYIVIDGKFYTFAYIPSTGYNQRVYAGWIATFVNAGEGIDVDMFFEHMSREAVYNKISTQLRMSRANAMDSHDTDSDYHARMEKISSSEYMLRGLSTGEDFYYMSMVITVVADSVDELEYKYDNLEKRVKGQGMKIRRANFMMEECFESVLLPLGKLNKDIKRKAQRNVLTSGVASCYPFISFEMQDPDGIMIGTNRANNSLVTIDMFDTDVHANANAVILGSTGYGKTFTAQLFALRLSEMDTQVFIISPLKGLEDYGGGCKAVGGQFISMDPSSVNSINIMDIRVPDDEDAKKMDDYETTGSLLTKKIHTVKSFLHLVVKDMTQEEEQLIDTSLYKVYGRFGITNDNDSIFDLENGGYKKMPLLEDLQKEMQNVPELHRICNILNPLIRGSMACYNRPTNVDLKAKYIVFDFNGMKGPTLTMSMFVVLDFVWTKIKEDRAKRKAVFIDECWKLIGTDSNEMAAEDVVEIFRTIRAYGGSAFAMTQDISQFYEYKGGKYGKAVIGNADTKIIMHLIPSEAKALQAAIQLTDSEMENVSNLGRGQGLVCSGAAKLFVDFIAAPYEKQEITTDAKSFYLQEKALKEKQHKEEQERLAAEKTNSSTDANDDDADLLNVTF